METINQETAVKNKINKIFKDTRLQAEYEKKMNTFVKPKLTIEQMNKTKKIEELSNRFFENARLKTKDMSTQIGKVII